MHSNHSIFFTAVQYINWRSHKYMYVIDYKTRSSSILLLNWKYMYM